jgi:hypothetical protein
MSLAVPRKNKRESIVVHSSQPSARAGKSWPFPRNKQYSRKAILLMRCFYVQMGKVKLTVVSKIGKEATIGILSEGQFQRTVRAGAVCVG